MDRRPSIRALAATALVATACAAAAMGACHAESPGSAVPATAPAQPPAPRAPVVAAPPTSTPSASIDATAAAASNRFAIDLYARLRRAAGGHNLFFSPLSASAALAMVATGARGATAGQIVGALHLGQGAPGQLGTLLASLSRPVGGETELDVANGLFVQEGRPLLPAFLDGLKRGFEAVPVQVDFAGDDAGATRTVDQWVAGKTRGLVPDLFAPGSLSPKTTLVLADAVYFKGRWVHTFEPRATRPRPFHAASGHAVTASMMSQQAVFPFYRDADVAVLEMPYAGGALAMDVILPAAQDGLSAVEAKLGSLPAWLAALRPLDVGVEVPRVKLASSWNLVAPLRALGVADAFEPRRADLSGIDGARDLSIGAVVQKAVAGIDEEGTVAAAATGVAVVANALRLPAARFVADHPFLLVLRDTRSGAIVFMGAVQDPTAG